MLKNSMMTRTIPAMILCVAAHTGFNTSDALAVPVSSTTTVTRAGFPQLTADTGDLIHQGAPSFVSMSLTSGSAAFGSSEQNLNDADMSDDSDGSNAFLRNTNDVLVLEILLDLTNSAAGYDISQVISHTGVEFDGRHNRMDQLYQFDVALVGDLGTYIPVFNTGHQNPSPEGQAGQLEVSTVDSLAAPLATGVGRILVTFQNTGEITAYSNLDIVGQATTGDMNATTPEPSTLMLALLSLIGLAVIRRTRRRCV